MAGLEGKAALVTGGARGIGRGIALALARAGADVAVADVDRLPAGGQQYGQTETGGLEAARGTAREIEALGRRALAVGADVTRKDQVEELLAQVAGAFGGLDVLVCNAGVVSLGPVEKLPEETWDLTFDVNAKGVFLCCQAAIPYLREREGSSILNVSSVAGKSGVPGMAHYCASKFAVVGFTNALAKELAAQGIRANAICPGILRTQMWEYLAESLKQPGEDREASWERWVKQMIPLGRPQTPDDIGALAVYLATAPNVTGQAINLDGGMEMH